MKEFKYVEIIAIHAWKQNSSNSFKNKITFNLFTYKSYMFIHLNVCKQIIYVKLSLLHTNTWRHLTMCKQMIDSKENYSD